MSNQWDGMGTQAEHDTTAVSQCGLQLLQSGAKHGSPKASFASEFIELILGNQIYNMLM